jgi:hypothetical protein
MARERRRSRARKGDGDYERPWLLKELYGAPVWALLGFGLVLLGLGVAYLLHR